MYELKVRCIDDSVVTTFQHDYFHSKQNVSNQRSNHKTTHQSCRCLQDVKAVNQVPVSPEELEELHADVQRQAVLSDLMWSLWAIRQAEVSTIDFDFMAYAISKYEGFRIKREKAFGA